MTDVLGSAYIEIRAKLDKFTADIGRGATAAVAVAAEKQASAIVRSSKVAESALSASNIKIADSARKAASAIADAVNKQTAGQTAATAKIAASYAAAADAATKASRVTVAATALTVNGIGALEQVSKAAKVAAEGLATANSRAAATISAFGRDSLQARAAVAQVAKAEQTLQGELQKTKVKEDQVNGSFKKGGGAASSAFGTVISSSQGALGPLAEVYNKVQGLGTVFTESGKSAGSAFAKIGAASIGLGALLGTISSKDKEAMAQLKVSVQNTGTAFDESLKKKIEDATSAGRKLGFSTPQTVQALNRLTLATHDPAKALAALSLAQNISAVRHVDLARAATLVGQAVNGAGRGLKPYGIVIESNAKSLTKLTSDTKAHTGATDALAKAQQKLKDFLAINAAKTGSGGDASLAAEKATVRVTAAQDSYNKALDKFGPGSTQATLASAKLNVAQRSASDLLTKGVAGTGLSVTKQIQLRKAQDAVTAAQAKATLTGKTLSEQQKTNAKVGDQFNQVLTKGNKILGGQAAAAASSFSGHLRVIKAQVENQVSSIGGKLVPVLVTAGPALLGVGAVLETGIIQKTGRGVKGLFALAEEGKKAGALRRVFSGVASGATSLVSGIGSAGKATAEFVKSGKIAAGFTKIWSGIQLVFNAVMAANPIVLITIGIVALVAVLIVAYKHSQTFRDIVTKVLSEVGKGFRFLADLVGSVFGFMKRHFDIFLAIFAPGLLLIKLVFNHFNEIRDFVVKVFSEIGDKIGAVFAGIGAAGMFMYEHALKPAFKFIVDGFLNLVGFLIRGAADAFGWIPGLGGKLQAAAKAFDKFKGDVNDSLNGIKPVTQITLDAVFNQQGQPVNVGSVASKRTGFVSGGAVFGPGSGTSDEVPAMLSRGEHVWTAREVAAAGGHDRVSGLRSRALRGFAAGGPVAVNLEARTNTSQILAGLGEATKTSYLVLADLLRKMGFASSAAGAGGNVQRWLPVVLSVLSAQGLPAAIAQGVLSLIANESGGDPNSINLTDSNARAGYPSQGLMQTIPQTFAAYAGKYASRGITDPFANIFAGVAYAVRNYGVGMLAAGGRHTSSGSYLGYSKGGLLPKGKIIGVNTATGQGITLNENGREYVIPANIVDAAQISARANAGMQDGNSGLNLGQLIANNATTSRAVGPASTRAASAQRLVTVIANKILGTQNTLAADKLHEAALRASIVGRSTTSGAGSDAARSRIAAISLQEMVLRQKEAGLTGPTYLKTREKAAINAQIAALRREALALRISESNHKGTNVVRLGNKIAIEAQITALRKHDAALASNVAALRKQETAAKAVAATAKTTLSATTKAAAAAKLALQEVVLARVAVLVDAFKAQASAGTDTAGLFNYQPGFGPNSNQVVIAQLRFKLSTMKRFGEVLRQLARRGAGPDLLKSLIDAGPQAGIAEAMQLLADPSSIVTIQSLQSDITSAGAAAAIGLATQVFAPALSAPVANTSPSPMRRPIPLLRPPHAPITKHAGPLIHIQNLHVRQESDIHRISVGLHQQIIASTRATGRSR